MATPFIPSSRPISQTPSQTFVGTSGDDIDEKTIAESDGDKRQSGQDQDKPEHHTGNIDVAPDTEELKKEGVVSGQDEFPDGGLRAWLVVLGGACVTFGTFGFVNAWGVFQAYYQETVLSDTSPSTIAWIGSVQYALVFLPGLVTGRLFDLGHYRIPQLCAAALLVIGTFLAAECHEYWQFLLCQGIAIGLASGFLFGPTIAVVSHWFRARRGLALGVLASGSSIGGTVIPIAVRKLIPMVGFKWAMRIIGFILLFVLSIAILTLRRRLPPKKVSGGLLNLKAFLHIPYTIYVLASVVSFLGLYTVLTYLEVYGTEIGLPEDFAFYMIPIANAASLFGRVGSGLVSDRIGPINTLIPSTLVAGVCTYAWPFARNKGSLIALACIYGTACGVFVGMLATPVAKMGGMDDVGRRTGMLMTVIAAGAVAGPPISGAIRDTTGSFVDVGYYAGSMIILCVLLLICVKFVALEYVLELEKSGYVVPRIIRQDLEYLDMIRALQNHRNRWQRQLGEPKVIKFPGPDDSITYFADGVYAYCYRTENSDGSIRSILHFYQLPSFNTGCEFNHWCFDNLGITVRTFAIQPKIDLMILLETYPYFDPLQSRYLIKRYRIHVRTMTTNEPHPQVTSSIGTTFLIDLGPLRRLVVLSYSRPIQIYGRMLSLVFRPEPNHPEQELLIVVFDWVAGVEVGRFDLPSHTRYSIAFISEEYFIIPQGYKCTGQHDSDQQGKINLFYSPFNKEVQHRQAKHIATFGFPHLHKNQTELSLYVHVVPALVPDTPYWATRVKLVPKIYEQNSRNHLCFSYEAFDNQGYLQSGFQSQLRFGNDLGTNGLLFIPPQVLLSLLDQHRRTSSGSSDQLIFVPWESWRSYTVCLADTEIPSASIWGHKYVFLHQGPYLRSQGENRAQINVWELEFRQRPPQKATPGTGGKWSNVSTFGQDATSNGVLSAYILQLPHPTQQEVSDLGAFGAAIPDMHVYCKQTTVDLDDKTNNILGAYDLEIDDEQFWPFHPTTVVTVKETDDLGNQCCINVYAL